MNPEQLAVMASNVESMREALLAAFIVRTLKAEDPEEYESLLAHFMKMPSFRDALDQLNEGLFGEVAA